MHGCLIKKTSDAPFKVYQTNHLKHNILSDSRETTILLCNVPSPDDPNKTKNVKVELIHVHQVMTTAACDSLKLNPDFVVELVLAQKLFINETFHQR